jgi:hypothetical protein
MQPRPNTPAPLILPGQPIGYASNDGASRYNLEAESTTGFVAWKIADGTTLISESIQTDIAESLYVSFWACAGYTDPTPDGRITYFDCHGNHLTGLDVRALADLEYLDCSFNQLAKLPLDGLNDLEALDADNNQLTRLEVRNLRALRVLNCAGNRLTTLDVSGLDLLQILDYSNNPIVSLKHDGCTALQDSKSNGNRLPQ